MAWVEKYRVEFDDLYSVTWTVKIYEDGYASGVIPLKGTGVPLIFEWLSSSDDLFEPIHETNVRIGVLSSTNFALADLYASEDMYFKVEVYSGSDLRFVGYVDCGNYEEPYEDIPYEVTITACCGLSFLKNMLYKYKTSTEDDTYYDGRLLESEILLDVLGKIGFTAFKEFVNIYEESMTATSGFSPCDQIRIDVDVFRDMYCYEVLQEILKKYNSCIRQVDGVFCLYRPVELDAASVYGRYFTADTTKTAVSITPPLYISREGNRTNILQVPGGKQMVHVPAKKVTIYQNYGNKESWLDNWQFASDKWSGGGIAVYDAQDWTRSGIGAAEIYPVGVGQPSQSDGVVLVGVNTYPTLDHLIRQSFGTYGIISATDTMCFEFEYQWLNRSAAPATCILYFKVESVNENYSLEETDGTYADWVTPAVNMSLTDIDSPDGDSGWKTYKRLFTGIDIVGPFKVTFYSPTDAFNVLVGIRNVRFYASNDTITTKKVTEFKSYGIFPYKNAYGSTVFRLGINWTKQKNVTSLIDNEAIVEHRWTKSNALSGAETEISVILGDVTKTGSGGVGVDNILEQFAGSLSTNVRTLLQVVHTVTLSADSPDGSIDITCNGVTKTATYSSSPTDTATAFQAANNSAWAATGVSLTNSGADLIFTGSIAGYVFIGDTEVTNRTGGLDGTAVITQGNSYSDAHAYSTDWNTRVPGSESKELGSIMVDEITAQYARPKQFIQMSIHDKTGTGPGIDLLGCYQDDVDQYGGSNRKFIISAGNYEVKQRSVRLDLIEKL